jgi:uncharacterized alpha-E superfamily protein
MNQPAVPIIPKFPTHQAARPMLARDADSMYWMSRYLERAEHVARLLLVNTNLLMDVGELAPTLQQRQWQSVLTILRADANFPGAPPPGANGDAPPPPLGTRVAQYMAFDPGNPNSLLNCLTRARENARGIRENISSEMWECLNTLYWFFQSGDARHRFEEAPDEFYRDVMTRSMLFQGLTDQTLAHDQGWHFAQLGKYLERIDVTSRIIETKFGMLRTADNLLAGALRNIHWMAVLRCCCSIESYRRRHVGDMDPMRVASYLILEREFPRSIRFAVDRAHDAITAIRAEVNPLAIDVAERILGRLDAQLEYGELSEILSEGIPAYLQKIQLGIAEAALALQKAYFLH